ESSCTPLNQSGFHPCPKAPPGDRSYLADFFSNLRQSVLLQLFGISIELANALGQLFGRHGVFVVHPAECFFTQAQLWLFACLRRGGIKLALHRTLGLFELIEKV